MNPADKHNTNPDEIRELSLDEMEAVEGGGLREIAAAVTLAAMTVTGAGNLAASAGALAEGAPNAIIEQMPEQETAEEDEAVEMTDVTEETPDLAEEDETVEAIDEDAVEADGEANGEAAGAEEAEEAGEALDEAEEEAVVEIESTETTEAVDEAEAGMDLMAAFSEADQAELAGEETEENDRTALAQQLIEAAMDEAEDKGIASAMDGALEALAEHADALSDGETGVLGVTGDEIIAMTVDAARTRFDVSDSLAMGAMGTAVERAVERGTLSALGGSATLANLAATNDSMDMVSRESATVAKNLMIGWVDYAVKNVDFMPFLGAPLKGIIEKVFGAAMGSPNVDQLILDELRAIEQQLTNMEKNLKTHVEDTLTLNSIGGEFQTLLNAITPLNNLIVDITGNTDLTQTEKDEKLAALYGTPTYNDIINAISGATNAFAGQTTFILTERSIFGAAYRRACSEVMFSGEAVDAVTPYLTRILGYYLRAYSLVNQVLTARESVYGANSCTGTRKQMYEDLGGLVNGSTNESTPGVMGLYAKFYDTNRYVFINRNPDGTGIQLSRILYIEDSATETLMNIKVEGKRTTYGVNQITELKNMPLSSAQVKAINDYCTERGISMLELLLNRVGFLPNCYVGDELKKVQAMIQEEIDKTENDFTKDVLRYYQTIVGRIPSGFSYNESTRRWTVSKVFVMPADKNALYSKGGTYHHTTYLKCVRVNATRTSIEDLKIEHDFELYNSGYGLVIFDRP